MQGIRGVLVNPSSFPLWEIELKAYVQYSLAVVLAWLLVYRIE
jgi:hypothetical protein